VSKKQFQTVYYNANALHKWMNNIAKCWNFEVLFFDNFRNPWRHKMATFTWMCP